MKVRVLSWALVLLLHGALLAWLARVFTAPSDPAQALPPVAVDMLAPERPMKQRRETPLPAASPPSSPEAAPPSASSPETPKKKPLASQARPQPKAPAPPPIAAEPAASSIGTSASPDDPPPSGNTFPGSGHAPPSPAVSASTPIYIPADYAASNRPPDYPALSRRYQEEGTVILRVLVRSDGAAGQIEIGTSSGYPLLDQAARRAVQRWRFVPATNNGQAVSDWFLLPVRFTLHE